MESKAENLGDTQLPLAGRAASPLQPLTPLAGTQELLDADNSNFQQAAIFTDTVK